MKEPRRLSAVSCTLPHPPQVTGVEGNRKTRWAPAPLSTLEMQKRGSQAGTSQGWIGARHCGIWKAEHGLRVGGVGGLSSTRSRADAATPGGMRERAAAGAPHVQSSVCMTRVSPSLPPPALQYLRMPGERIMKHAEELYQQASCPPHTRTHPACRGSGQWQQGVHPARAPLRPTSQAWSAGFAPSCCRARWPAGLHLLPTH